MKPFRILMIDDLTAKALQRGNSIEDTTSEQPLWILKTLQQIAGSGMELYLAQDVSFRKRPVIPIVSPDGVWKNAYLSALDVLILDLGGVGPLRKEWNLKLEDFPVDAQPSEADLQLLNFAFPGAGFYLKLRNQQLKTCQAVIILSEHDIEAKEEAPEIIRRFIDPCCRPDAVPWTIKHTPSPQKIERIVDLIEALYTDFTNGFTLLKNRGAIEFAANHDQPVMIVGESGTGKEYIAEAIHRRWAQEKRKEGFVVPDRPVVVNCAGLSPELAKSELFGYVKGSFTGAYEHRTGAILQACGVQGFASGRPSLSTKKLKKAAVEYRKLANCIAQFDHQKSDREKLRFLGQELLPLLNELMLGDHLHSPFAFFSNLHRRIEQVAEGPDYVAEYQRELVHRNPELLEARGIDIRFCRNRTHSTLFLDEFADLAPDVQTLLLRYLQSKEVQPIGYPGRIERANVRIIVASSDPRIAEFVGESLIGGWRSQSELARPLREDLIFRVKGQVIRSRPVTESNVKECIRHFVSRSKGPKWQEETIEYLSQLMKRQLRQIRQATLDIANGQQARKSPSFGHLREIARVISLVNTYVATAQKRGLRSIQKKVTRDIVETVWKPSTVVSYDALSPIEKDDQYHQTQRKAIALRRAIEAFFSENGKYDALPELWDNKAFRKKLNAMVDHGDLEGLVKLQHLVVKNQSIPVYCKAFDIEVQKEGTIRAWFTRKIKKLNASKTP